MKLRLTILIVGCAVLISLIGNKVMLAQTTKPEEESLNHCIGFVSTTTDAQSLDEPTDEDINIDLETLENRVYLPLVNVEIASEPIGEPTEVSATGVNCFSTFSDAIRAATDGAVQLSSSVTPTSVTQDMLQGTTARTVIGVMYQHSNFGGSSFTWTASNSYGCRGYYGSYYVATPPRGWNDTVSSARAFGGCNKWYHYEHNYYGGAALVCNNGYSCYSGYGTMNDSASSWRWWGSGFHY